MTKMGYQDTRHTRILSNQVQGYQLKEFLECWKEGLEFYSKESTFHCTTHQTWWRLTYVCITCALLIQMALIWIRLWRLKEKHKWKQIQHLATSKELIYRNPSLELTTKARVCKGAGQMWSLGVTFHAHGSVGKCKGMSPHVHKWDPTLGVGVLMKSWIFREWF